jgi:hypothetical protein
MLAGIEAQKTPPAEVAAGILGGLAADQGEHLLRAQLAGDVAGLV